jgi:hypothetical protein
MRLVTFGDSWPRGCELAPGDSPYGEILAGRFNVPFQNFSKNATSNDHMILQLQRYIDSSDDVANTLAVFFITSPARCTLIDYDGSEISIYPWSDRSRGEHAYAWFKYFHTPLQDRLRTLISVLSLQRICQIMCLKDYYIVGWNEIDFNFPGINLKKIYPRTCAEMFGAPGAHEFTMAKDNVFVRPNNCHPNQKGHELIANTLYEWISNDHTTA